MVVTTEEAKRMRIRFADWGPVLGTRELGATVRNVIEQAIHASADTVVLDFAGVVMVGSSFADECVAKLVSSLGLDEMKRRTTFRNVAEPVALIIRGAIAERNRDVVVAR